MVRHRRVRLARARRAAGHTQESLAELLRLDRSTVVRWERAETEPQPWIRHRMARALGLSPAALDDVLSELTETASTRLGQAEKSAEGHIQGGRHRNAAQSVAGAALPELTLMDDLRDDTASGGLADLLDETAPAVTAATTTRLVHEWLVAEAPQVVELAAGRRIGVELVARVERRVVQLRHLDDFVGGRDLHQIVEHELRLTGRLPRDSSHADAMGRRLFTAVGELCQLAGWVATDAGQHDRAAHHCAVGVKAAHIAGNRPLAANLISTLAYQISNVGSPLDAVLLAQTAATGAGQHATGTTSALLLERVAFAHARAGNTRQAERALVAVERQYDQRRPSDDPEWVYWLNEDEVPTCSTRRARAAEAWCC